LDDPRIQETVRSLRALDEPDKITGAREHGVKKMEDYCSPSSSP